MFTVYVLRSLKDNKRYVGYAIKLAPTRLKEHNLGSNRSARMNKPFVIIHQEKFDSKADAIKREKFLKSGQGRKYLNNLYKKFQ